MLDISHNNLFITRDSRSNYGIRDVLNFYDMEGTNWIFAHRGESPLKYIIDNRILVYRPSGIGDLFEGGSNLFRVNLLVIESNTDILDEVRKHINIPVIVIGDLSFASKKKGAKRPIDLGRFDLNKYDHVYEFFTDTKNTNSSISGFNITKQDTDYMVKDIKTNDEYDLEHARIMRIRDKKIGDILD